jgi:lipopolysaccharide biosynthesis protein
MQPARQARPGTGSSERSVRSRMIAAIHLKFKKLRTDLRFCSDEEIRDERLAFINDALKSKRAIISMRDLSDRQLGLVLDALSRLETQPQLPNSQAANVAANAGNASAEIIHLASSEQQHTIEKLFNCLAWDDELRASFVKQKFKSSPAMLTFKQANSLTMILLTIAATRAIKGRGSVQRVSRLMIREEIPALKARLGIDRKSDEGGR